MRQRSQRHERKYKLLKAREDALYRRMAPTNRFWHAHPQILQHSQWPEHAWGLQVFNLLCHCAPSISFLGPLCKWTCTTANCFDAVWVEHTGLPPCPNSDFFSRFERKWLVYHINRGHIRKYCFVAWRPDVLVINVVAGFSNKKMVVTKHQQKGTERQSLGHEKVPHH